MGKLPFSPLIGAGGTVIPILKKCDVVGCVPRTAMIGAWDAPYMMIIVVPK